jgi:Spy/CpxP family protein refolding chaperone
MTRSHRKFVAISGLWAALILAFPALPGAAQSPYVELKDREIKALDPSEVNGLTAGEGLGMALPAEMNGYPGPKHVLDMAAELSLTEAQVAKTQGAYDVMHEAAVRLGREIVDAERELDRLFASGRAGEAPVRKLSARLGDLRGQLRFTHLKAHLAMMKILSPAQVRRYSELRGYSAPR